MSLLNFIGESAGNFLKKMMMNQGQDIIYRAKLEMWRFQRRLIKSMIAVFVLLLAFVALVFAAIFYLIDYVSLGRTLTFLIVGVILLIIGVMLKI